MSDKATLNDLQTLWEELNQSEEERQQQALNQRLRERAQQYAKPQRQEQSFAEDAVYQVLVFALGDERYALDVTVVRGVRTRGHVTRVPGTPAFYRGVVNVRGQIISVLDLRFFFGLNAEVTERAQELVLVEAGELELGLLANHVEEVLTIPKATVEPIEMKYARGVTAERLVILDIEFLFDDDRLIIGKEIN